MRRNIACSLLWLVALIWGAGFVVSDFILQSVTPAQYMFWRFGIAAILLGLLNVNKIFSITKVEGIRGVILGICLFASFYLQTVGLKYTTPSKNAFLSALYVIFVPIFGYVFCRHRLGVDRIFFVILAVMGSALMSLTEEFSIGLGDLLTLGCAIFFGLQIFATNEFVKGARPQILVFVELATVAILSFILAVRSGISLPQEPMTRLALLASGTIIIGLCYIIQSWSQQFVGETTVALILSLESIFGMGFSVWLLSEVVTGRMLIGATLIMLAVMGCIVLPQKKGVVSVDKP